MTPNPAVEPVSASAYDIGVRHGREHRAHIHDFLERMQPHGTRASTGPRASLHEAYLQQCATIIEADVPAVADELRGLAAGAGISYGEAVALHYWRETAGDKPLAPGECSTLAALDFAGAPTIAQNIDLPAAMQGLGYATRCRLDDHHATAVLSYTFGGLLGFVGLNSHGLAIGINLVLSNDWQPGVSPYLLVRHLLSCESTQQCLAEIGRIRRSSSRTLVICDQAQLLTVEMTATRHQVLGGASLFHTNHFLHPALVAQDAMNIFSRNTSALRLGLLQKGFGELSGTADVDALFALLSDHSLYPLGLCVHPNAGWAREQTVACVILRPTEGVLHVREGLPCSSPTVTVALR